MDLNSDGRLDLAITADTSFTSTSSAALFASKGKADGTFGPVVPYATPNLWVGHDFHAADFDRDGITDWVVPGSGQNGSGIVYFHGVGGGVLEAGTEYDLPLWNGKIIVTDVDGSHGPDILPLTELGFARLMNTGHR